MAANTTGASSVGTTLHVCATAPTTYDAAGYAALTWIKFGEVESIPQIGSTRTVGTFTPLESGAVQKYITTEDGGKVSIPFLSNTDDVGQIVIETATTSKSPISCKITKQNGDIRYFRALVLANTETIGGAKDLTMGSVDLDITSTSAGVIFVKANAA